MKEVFYYARVSTKEQNLSRQLQAFEELGADRTHTFTDKVSGKTMNRPAWNELHAKLRAGDTLVIYSLDRLGRNYEQIKETWSDLTRKGVAVHVLDMPILNTDQSTDNVTSQFISDLVLQILAYVSQKERENIKARQAAGMNAMRKDSTGHRVSARTGRRHGRPCAAVPENWEEVFNQWQASEITAKEAMRLTGLKRNTFYKMAKSETVNG